MSSLIEKAREDAVTTHAEGFRPQQQIKSRGCRPILFGILLVLGLDLIQTSGCRSHAPVAPSPTAPLVLAAEQEEPENSTVILAQGSCGVRLPTTLAIAQLNNNPLPSDAEAVDVESAAGVPVLAREEPLQLVFISPADQGRWVEIFLGVGFVCDLQFLSPIDLKTQGGGLPEIQAAARRAGAGLLLAYAAERCGPNSACVLGSLYCVASGERLADLRSRMQFLNEKGEECAVDDEHGDHREIDAVYQAARQFRTNVLNCTRELARLTPVEATTQPHRWIPLYPYCWQPLPHQRPEAPSAPAVPAPRRPYP